jgi:Domain of unknown function (DUF4389)
MEIMEDDHATTPLSRWLRAFYLLFFMCAFAVGQTVLGLITVVQFAWLLAAGEPNHGLRRFGASLAQWFADAVRFLTCASDEKPFPWRDWPSVDIANVVVSASLKG